MLDIDNLAGLGIRNADTMPPERFRNPQEDRQAANRPGSDEIRMEMYELKIITSFAAAHCLREFKGKCESLHGHNWKVEVCVRSPNLDRIGLVIDFKEIKKATEEVLDELDHKHLNDLLPFQVENPSSENIARFLFQTLSSRINRDSLRVSRVTAWESDDACASYFEEE